MRTYKKAKGYRTYLLKDIGMYNNVLVQEIIVHGSTRYCINKEDINHK